MQLTTIVGEAARSLLASRGRNTLLLLVLAFCTFLPAYFELRATGDVVNTYRAGIKAGNGVIVVTRESGGSLDPAVCAALALNPDVVSGGSLELSDLVRPTTSPGVSIQSVRVSPGFLRVVDPTISGDVGAAALGVNASRELGIIVGGTMRPSSDSTLRIGAIVANSARAPIQSRWLYLVEAPLKPTECWLEAAPGSRSGLTDIVRARYSNVSDIRVSALVPKDSRQLLAGWEGRVSRFAWLPLGFIGGVAATIISIGRRNEYGLRRSLGIPRSQVLLQLQTETLLLDLGALVVSSSWIVACSIVASFDGRIALPIAARAGLLTFVVEWVAAQIGSAMLASSNVFDALRARS